MNNFKFSLFGISIMLILSVFSFSNQSLHAQKILSGDLKFLKGQKSINVVFDYTNFKIEKDTEVEYLTKEVADMNKKDAGSGDKFREEWEKDKQARFIDAFNKDMKEKLDIPINDAKAKYTVIISNINLINKGWGNKFSGGNPATMQIDFKFVETDNQTVVACVAREERAQYMSFTGTLAQKIQGCLEYGGEQLGKLIRKKI